MISQRHRDRPNLAVPIHAPFSTGNHTPTCRLTKPDVVSAVGPCAGSTATAAEPSLGL